MIKLVEFFQIACALVLLWLAMSQVIIPVFGRRKIFPMFRNVDLLEKEEMVNEELDRLHREVQIKEKKIQEEKVKSKIRRMK